MNSTGTIKAGLPSTLDPADRGRELCKLRDGDGFANRKEGVHNPLIAVTQSIIAQWLSEAKARKAELRPTLPAPKPVPTVPLWQLNSTKERVEAYRTLAARLKFDLDKATSIAAAATIRLDQLDKQANDFRNQVRNQAASIRELQQLNRNQEATITAYQKRFGPLSATPKISYTQPPKREQSEDRIPTTGLYLVVSVEVPGHGLLHYVQHPNGKRNSLYTRSNQKAIDWAISQEKTAECYVDPAEWGSADRIVA